MHNKNDIAIAEPISEMETKEEILPGVGLQNKVYLVKERETNIPLKYSDDGEIFVKKETSAEPCFERTHAELGSHLEEPPGSFTDSETNQFPSEHTKCKSDTGIYSNNAMNVKVEIKEEPWWLESTLHSEVFPVLEPGLQNKDKDAYDVDSSPMELPRKCKEESDGGEGICVSGFSTDGYTEKINYIAAKEDNIGCEELIISDAVTSASEESNVFSLSSNQRHGNHSGEKCTLTSTLENNSLIQEGKLVHRCTVCDRTFPWMAWLKKHYLIHEGIKPHKCEICEKTFTYKQSLNHHYLTHEGKRSYICKICGKGFIQNSNLKKHTLIHEGKRSYKCEICGKSYTEKHSLKEHNFTHEGRKPHKCKICDKSFTYKQAFRQHYLIHEGKRKYTCQICGKSFIQNRHLKKHTLIHEGKKPYKCEICGKSYAEKHSLKEHNFVHEGQRPHKCEICDKSFTYKQSLKQHYLIHEGKRQYTCEVCNKRFTHKSYLKKHISIHEGMKPYKCEICNKSFMQEKNFNKHCLIHSPK